ncbi:sugar phosphate isomerase/epimerase [Patescibacteria group bacterium]|nr:sugar phosphate isomerase/epimerase [Patescibacteria group bacterium]MBU4162226.1 sugar phosphate isomerase/epimerase [Patescibacteria group bacterium]
MTDIAISNLAWNESADQQIFEAMRNLEIFSLEISPFRDVTGILEVNKRFDNKMSKLLNSYGIHIVALQSLMFRYPGVSLFKDEATRSEMFEHLVSILEFSNKVGSTIVVFGSPKNKIKSKLSREGALDIAKNFFRKLADQAQRLNITFCIEPTPAVYGADFILNTNEALDCVKGVNRKSIKINLDIGSSILNNEKIEGIIRDNIKYIGHVHISEPYLKAIDCNYLFHRNIAQALNNSNYKGVVSIEMLPAGKSDAKNISEVLSFVKNVYQLNYEK